VVWLLDSGVDGRTTNRFEGTGRRRVGRGRERRERNVRREEALVADSLVAAESRARGDRRFHEVNSRLVRGVLRITVHSLGRAVRRSFMRRRLRG
jgi:hypothetical protein